MRGESKLGYKSWKAYTVTLFRSTLYSGAASLPKPLNGPEVPRLQFGAIYVLGLNSEETLVLLEGKIAQCCIESVKQTSSGLILEFSDIERVNQYLVWENDLKA